MKKEVSSDKRRSLTVLDRRRLANMIPEHAHRGLRMLCSDEVLDVQIDCPVNITAREFACAQLNDIRFDIGKLKDMIDPILEKMVNSGNTGYFDQVAKPLLFLNAPIPGISDVAKKAITILDFAELLVGKGSGVESVRTVLWIYRVMKNISELFRSATNDGILLADFCRFKPGKAVLCTEGLT